MSVVELRQYTLLPGRRDELIEIFEHNFLDEHRRCGIEVVGLSRDVFDPARFVWIRRFANMQSRPAALQAFYGGPVWRRLRDIANATMADSDNVLLLRPAWPGSDFPPAARLEATAGDHGTAQRGIVQVGIVPFARPPHEDDFAYFVENIVPRLHKAGASVLACLVSEPSANTFPALPVREGENVLAWFAGFSDAILFNAARGLRFELRYAAAGWPGVEGALDLRILTPTRRSPLLGASETCFSAVELKPTAL
jgi:hypothetical protein